MDPKGKGCFDFHQHANSENLGFKIIKVLRTYEAEKICHTTSFGNSLHKWGIKLVQEIIFSHQIKLLVKKEKAQKVYNEQCGAHIVYRLETEYTAPCLKGPPSKAKAAHE